MLLSQMAYDYWKHNLLRNDQMPERESLSDLLDRQNTPEHIFSPGGTLHLDSKDPAVTGDFFSWLNEAMPSSLERKDDRTTPTGPSHAHDVRVEPQQTNSDDMSGDVGQGIHQVHGSVDRSVSSTPATLYMPLKHNEGKTSGNKVNKTRTTRIACQDCGTREVCPAKT